MSVDTVELFDRAIAKPPQMDPALAGFLGKLAEKLDRVEVELAKTQQATSPQPTKASPNLSNSTRRFRSPSTGATQRSPPTFSQVSSVTKDAASATNSDVVSELRAVRELLSGIDTNHVISPRGQQPMATTPMSATGASRSVTPSRTRLPAATPVTVETASSSTEVVDSLRRELRRVSEAYSTLVRDSRAQKGVWAAREQALQAEVERLRSAVSNVGLDTYATRANLWRSTTIEPTSGSCRT